MKQLADQYPFLAHADKLKFNFPSLGTSVRHIINTNDSGRRLLNDVSLDKDGNRRPPGRCCVLEFRDSPSGAHVEDVIFKDISSLANYLELHSPLQGKAIDSDCLNRLYILEDLSPEYIDLLGAHLRVDPLVISSHMNTWRNLDARTLAQRTLPSLRNPRDMFTVRYPELRVHGPPVEDTRWTFAADTRWTFAANRRKFDPWFQIPGGAVDLKGDVSITRRCASFWVNSTQQGGAPWNALLLVDPPIDAYKVSGKGITPGSYRVLKKASSKGPELAKGPQFETEIDWSKPYHFSHPDPISSERAFKLTVDYCRARGEQPPWRVKSSMFDEVVLYWTQKDNTDLVRSAIQNPVNAMHYALKIAAYNWTHLIELVLFTINQAEFVADLGRDPRHFDSDNASRNSSAFSKTDAVRLYKAIFFLNIFRRRLGFYEDDLDLALENLGYVSDDMDRFNLPSALRDAHLDFSTLSKRLKLFKSRVDNLATTADEIVNLRSAKKSLDDGDFNLRLAILAAIVFPVTLVAAIFGMSDTFKPGDGKFWIFWAVSLPLTVVMVWVIVGWRPTWQTLRKLKKENSRDGRLDPDVSRVR